MAWSIYLSLSLSIVSSVCCQLPHQHRHQQRVWKNSEAIFEPRAAGFGSKYAYHYPMLSKSYYFDNGIQRKCCLDRVHLSMLSFIQLLSWMWDAWIKVRKIFHSLIMRPTWELLQRWIFIIAKNWKSCNLSKDSNLEPLAHCDRTLQRRSHRNGWAVLFCESAMACTILRF